MFCKGSIMINPVQVRGVLVNTNDLKGAGSLVTLTLSATDEPGLKPDSRMKDIHRWEGQDWAKKRIKPEFEDAAQRAFERFPDANGAGVQWLLTRDDRTRDDNGTLHRIGGPSLGVAFAVGRILLQRDDVEAQVVRSGLRLMVISAQLGKDLHDDIQLSLIGELGSKLRALQDPREGIQALAIADDQDDVPGDCGLRLIKASSVKKLITEMAKAMVDVVYDL